MSLLLSSLKKADQENAQASETEVSASQPAAAGAPQAAATSATPQAASASGTEAGATGAAFKTAAPESAPAGGADAPIDFDTIVDEGAPEESSSSSASEPQEKELVSASRVFRANVKDEGGGRGVTRVIYGILGVVVFAGGGFFVVESGVIPGVSFSSLRDMVFGDPAPAPVVQTETSIPELAAGGDDAALLLPQPVVDIQSEIATFSDFSNAEALETPEGRRAFANRVVAFADTSEEEAEALAGLDGINEQEFIAPGLDAGIDEEAVEVEIKTAEVSRERKKSLDAQTPVDNILQKGITSNNIVETFAQADATGGVTEDADGNVEPVVGDDNVAGGTAPATGTVSEPGDSSADTDTGSVKVKASLSGIDRKRMLNEATQLYVSGAYAEAEAVYRGILAKSATNIDGLRGLALVAVATGRYQLAAATYLKILEYYPKDPVAIADLTNLHGVSGENFYAVEEALKRAIGGRPEWDGRLYFALGNLYAGNRRWLDAQKAYFDAYANEQENPDYAYNLAVMLDYLNKPLLAVEYYRQALDLSRQMPVGFDAAQVESRIERISE